MALAPNTGYGLLNPGTTAAPRVKAPGAPYVAPQVQNDPATVTNTQSPVDYYQSVLGGDPLLKQTLAGLNASGVTNQATLAAQQQRALIQRGLVPSGTLPGSPGIDATTAALAAQNTLAGTSTQAGLTRAYQTADQASVASEAARGMLRSGAYGQHAAENLQGFNQAGYTADQSLMDYLQGIYSGYLSQQQQLQSQATSASGDAYSRLIAQINAGQVTYPTQVPNPGYVPPASAPTAPNSLYSLLNPYRPPAPAAVAPPPVSAPRRGPAVPQ